MRPENILIDQETGYIKLFDFSSAKLLSPHKNRTYTKIGSPCYLAPEIIKHGKFGEESGLGYSYECDIWAFGVLICEITGGFNPFFDYDVMKIYDNIINMRINWPKNMCIKTKEMLE